MLRAMFSPLALARRLVQAGVRARQTLDQPAVQVALLTAALTFGVKAMGKVLENVVDELEDRKLVDGVVSGRIAALEDTVAGMVAARGETYPRPVDLDPLQRGETPVYEAAAAADGVPSFDVDEVFPDAASFDGFSVAGDGR
jgi:hypothetical protein